MMKVTRKEVNRLSDMNEKRYDVATVKERLKLYRDAERDIDNQIERLERIVAKMTSAGTKIITDMPKAPSAADDRMAELVGLKEELELSIKKAIKSQSEKRDKIESILGYVQHPDERAVIRIRYIDRENWRTVAKMMFGMNDDFDYREDTYVRRVHKIHGSALLDMARIMDELCGMKADPQTNE